MTTNKELFEKLKSLTSFVGVFSSNNIPNIKIYPSSLIANSHPTNKPGEHWIAMYINEDKFGIYFNSYGLYPLNQEFEKFLNDHTNNWIYNKTMLQSLNSTTCGHYCVLFILLITSGYSLNDIVSKFTKNTKINDLIIKNLYNEI